jgi:hypothetical protein
MIGAGEDRNVSRAARIPKTFALEPPTRRWSVLRGLSANRW